MFYPMTDKLSFKHIVYMRRNYVGKSCKLHFEAAPLRIERASKQFMYDEAGNEYLDCINNIAHVGHCHPHVVAAGQKQMAQLSTCQGFLTTELSMYAKRLIETLPDNLCVCYFVNSGSEANDLALRLAMAYTKNQDILCIDNSYHGMLGSLIEVSPKMLNRMKREPKNGVHIVPTPDRYKGKYRFTSEDQSYLYSQEVLKVINSICSSDKGIAAFISEPVISQAGVIIPPKDYLKTVYRYIREAGGLCIADEILTGLGRTGEYWAFQTQDVVPDIVTCGKPMGNGHPMAVVITSREIADSVCEFSSGFGGNPVSCAIGMAVLDVIKNEKLLSSAKYVGQALVEGFRSIMPKHHMMGDVRGIGLVVGVEIVTDKESKKPARDAAELLCYKLKQGKILLANNGPQKNILIVTPPMCFTCENAKQLISLVDKSLLEIEYARCPEKVREMVGSSVEVETTRLDIPVNVVTGNNAEFIMSDDEDDDDVNSEPNFKKPRYDDLD